MNLSGPASVEESWRTGSSSPPIWMVSGNEKRSRVKQMFGELASTYDLLNSLITFRLHYRWRSIAAKKLRLQTADTVLDLCCGSGSFIPILHRLVGNRGRVFGFDFSMPMLKVAKGAGKELGRLSLGDALMIPLSSNSLDGVTVGWGIRNVVDTDAAHREIFRVLRSGKRFVSIDTQQPKNPVIRKLSSVAFVTLVPAVAGLFGKRKAYLYLPKSTERFKSREELKLSMENAGFVGVSWQDLMFGNVCIHWGIKP